MWGITIGRSLLARRDREGCRQKVPSELLLKHWQELQRRRRQASGSKNMEVEGSEAWRALPSRVQGGERLVIKLWREVKGKGCHVGCGIYYCIKL